MMSHRHIWRYLPTCQVNASNLFYTWTESFANLALERPHPMPLPLVHPHPHHDAPSLPFTTLGGEKGKLFILLFDILTDCLTQLSWSAVARAVHLRTARERAKRTLSSAARTSLGNRLAVQGYRPLHLLHPCSFRGGFPGPFLLHSRPRREVCTPCNMKLVSNFFNDKEPVVPSLRSLTTARGNS